MSTSTPKEEDTPKEAASGITTLVGIPILKTPPPPRDDDKGLPPPPPLPARASSSSSRPRPPPHRAHRPTESERNAYFQAIAIDSYLCRATELRLRGIAQRGEPPLIPRDESLPSSEDAHRAYYGLDPSTCVLPFILYSDYVPYDFSHVAGRRNRVPINLRPRVGGSSRTISKMSRVSEQEQ